MNMKKVLKTLILTCLAVAVSFAALAQQEVKGVVTDEAGEPLPGVAVVIQGTSTGTITNMAATGRRPIGRATITGVARTIRSWRSSRWRNPGPLWTVGCKP